MAGLSQQDRNIIKNHPLAKLVDLLRGALQEAEKVYESCLIYDGVDESLDQLYRNVKSKFLSALQGEDAAYSLRSRMSNGTMVSDLAAYFVRRLQKAQGNFKYDDYRSLVCLVTPDNEIYTPVKFTSSSQKGSEQTRELVDLRIFEEIHDCTFQDVEGFFDKYFEEKDWSSNTDAICQHILAPDSDGNWAHFPNPPTQDDVLAWWFHLQEDLLSESHSIYYTTMSKADLTGAKAEWQVNLLLTKMGVWVFDHSGPYSSGIINVYTDLRQFFQVPVGYTMMSDEELELDIFISRDEDSSK
ncbi:uncharacterized protein PADG_02107 [Paracoccidioides brasiliensis Pb18]|uniref:Fungal-type protein kinase domain-containing protein n=1 Tax=Paracoccidioides brasiliensis (strain Pb18) TaxID=502780 RepID=C1G1U1_PARBD|nr:uncharacterized protein PADG_02107 [Paracoccidioides brasiliensis Pb18]EEH45957.2 hypothetical protein PADG_02107 [Paracoccidioides brasiliensis Pb18]